MSALDVVRAAIGRRGNELGDLTASDVLGVLSSDPTVREALTADLLTHITEADGCACRDPKAIGPTLTEHVVAVLLAALDPDR